MRLWAHTSRFYFILHIPQVFFSYENMAYLDQHDIRIPLESMLKVFSAAGI